MKWWILAFSIFIILSIAILLPLQFELLLKKQGKDDWLGLKLSIGSLPLLHLKIPSIRQRWDLATWELSMESIMQGPFPTKEQLITIQRPIQILKKAYDSISPRIRRLLIKLAPDLLKEGKKFIKNVECIQWKWNTRVGGNDPASTGLLIGIIWYIKHFSYRRLIINMAGMTVPPNFAVIPEFCEPAFELEFHCIFTFRGGHIITTTCRVWWLTLCYLMKKR